MNALLDRLEALAKAADRETQSLSVSGQTCPWFDVPSLVARDIDGPDAAYIAALSPDAALKLIEAARAANFHRPDLA